MNAAEGFVPHEYGHLTAELADARATNAALRDELAEVARLRERYGDLQTRLQDAERVLVNTRAGLADAHALYLQLLDELIDVRAQYNDISRRLEGIHPFALGLARRVTKVSNRFPRAVAGAQRLADARLALKRAGGWVPD